MSIRPALIAAPVLLLGSCGGSEPSHLRFINLVERADAVAARMCDARDRCRSIRLVEGAISRVLTVPPGTYSFAVSVAGREVSTFRYGIGSGEHYGLALYGIADPPVRKSRSTTLRRLLGGSDQAFPAGEQLAHRMVTMRPGQRDDPARARLANFSPGAVKIGGSIVSGITRVSLSPVAYGAVSDAVKVGRPDAVVRLNFRSSPFALVKRRATFPAGSMSVIYVGGLDEGTPRIVRDMRHP